MEQRVVFPVDSDDDDEDESDVVFQGTGESYVDRCLRHAPQQPQQPGRRVGTWVVRGGVSVVDAAGRCGRQDGGQLAAVVPHARARPRGLGGGHGGGQARANAGARVGGARGVRSALRPEQPRPPGALRYVHAADGPARARPYRADAAQPEHPREARGGLVPPGVSAHTPTGRTRLVLRGPQARQRDGEPGPVPPARSGRPCRPNKSRRSTTRGSSTSVAAFATGTALRWRGLRS